MNKILYKNLKDFTAMKKLSETELFESRLSRAEKEQMNYAMMNSVALDNIGVIAPHHIESELTQLKIKSRAGSIGVMTEAIAMYEGFNGRIRLFNLGGTAGSGRSPVPAFIPFSRVMARNRAMQPNGPANRSDLPKSPAMCMNLHRIGNWDANGETYLGLAPATDLYTLLESGYVMYKLLVESNNVDRILSNKRILDSLTNIYTFMFSKAIIKASKAIFSTDFMKTASDFIIANFFLKYVVELTSKDAIKEYAFAATDGKTSMASLQNFEENSGVSYNSLTEFLKTYGETFFNEPLLITKFQYAWNTIFGESLIFAVEFLPYLIHYLLAAVHGANLGGSTRLVMHKPDLIKKGLDTFYRTLLSELR